MPLDIGGIDEMLAGLELEGERIAAHGPEAVQAGAKLAVEAMQQSAPVRTGGLRDHIKAAPVQHNPIDGYYTDVYPQGKDERGERYETIGFVLEHGRSNMAARPWMAPAVESSGEQIAQAMAEILTREG